MSTQDAFTDALLKSRVQDGVRLCQSHDCPQFLGFLDERQKKLTEVYFKQEHAQAQACYWGGYPDAERTFLGIFPEYYEYGGDDFPIMPLEVSYSVKELLTHRDFLGSLMELGIKREVLGDILIENGRCLVFASAGISEYLLSQWNKVGRVNVKCSVPAQLNIPSGNGFMEISGTVASARLDCVVACLLKTSRSSAVDVILQHRVGLDFTEITDISKRVFDGQTITVRGYGKYKIDEVGSLTKKAVSY